MAKKSFLSPVQLEIFETGLTKAAESIRNGGSYATPQLSVWLSDRLHENLSAHPDWLAACPIALGSWARDEITPMSDIDLIFCGDEKAAGRMMLAWQKAGLRVRGRVPEISEDWTVGTDPFDALAILHGRALTAEGVASLLTQRKMILSKGAGFKRRLLTEMKNEREQRRIRYGSIINYLEPHLKYGPGGLRDLQQGLYIRDLYPHRFSSVGGAGQRLMDFRDFLLFVRRKLQVDGAGDILLASEQDSIARWLGFKNSAAFMRELQKGLSLVNFYGDWLVAFVRTPKAKAERYQGLNLDSPTSLFRSVLGDPSVLMQRTIREYLDGLGLKYSGSPLMGKALHQVFVEGPSEKQVDALFRSGIVETTIPGFLHLVGLVQHDQYHRYTADGHLQQCLRQAVHVRKHPKSLGQLEKVVRGLSEEDWCILSWASLYHDIGKGRKGDHSAIGARMVQEDFKHFGLSGALSREVEWLVLNHLALSDAAFRKNPRVPSTWRELVDLGVVGKRLPRLAIFTAIDILGTNPDAWSSWKERLLKDLVDVMASSPALNFAELMASLRLEHGKVNWEFMQQLDPAVIDSISKSILAKEYIQLRSCERKKRQSLDPLVIMDRERRMWVRLHVRQDEPGVFAELLKKLYSLGLRINYAAAQTYEKWGVYDWFQVASHKRVAWVRNQLSIVLKSGRVQVSLPEVLFRKVTVVSESDQEVVISFRGKDRPGALAVSAQALSEEGFDILWARAHTWGRQLDDSFGVRPIAGLNGRLENICEKLLQVPVAKTQGGTSR